MSTEELQIITNICFVLAIIFTIISVVMFFAFDVISMIGELSGMNAKKQVNEIREQRRRLYGSQQNRIDSRKSSAEVARKIYDAGSSQWQEKISQETMFMEEETILLEEETMLLTEERTFILGTENGLHICDQIMEVHTEEYIDI